MRSKQKAKDRASYTEKDFLDSEASGTSGKGLSREIMSGEWSVNRDQQAGQLKGSKKGLERPSWMFQKPR